MRNVMKSLRSVMLGGFAMFAVLLLTSCGEKYAKVLPADCSGVMKIDVASITEKAALEDNNDIKDVKEAIIEQCDKQGVSSEAQARIKELLEDPAKCGLDLRDPVFVYAPSKSFGYAGLVAKVHSVDDLKTNFELLKKEEEGLKIKEYETCTVVYAENEDEVAIAWNDESFMVAGTVFGGSSKSEARIDLRKHFEKMQDAEETIYDNKSFARLLDLKDDFAACMSMKDYMEMLPLSSRDKEEIESLIKDVPIKDFSYVMGLNFMDDAIVAHSELVAETDKAKKLLDEQKNLVDAVSAKYWDMLPNDAVAVLGANVHGKKLWDAMAKFSFIKDILNKNEEAKAVISHLLRAVEGESAMSISVKDDEPAIAGFYGIGGKKQADDFFKLIADKYGKREVYSYYDGVQTVEQFYKDPTADRWLFKKNPRDPESELFVAGATNDYAYFNTDSNFKPGQKPAKSLTDKEYKSRVEGKYGYFIVDFVSLMNNEQLKKELTREFRGVSALQDFVDKLSTFEVYVNEDLGYEAQLRFHDLDKGKTPLMIIAESIAESAAKMVD